MGFCFPSTGILFASKTVGHTDGQIQHDKSKQQINTPQQEAQHPAVRQGTTQGSNQSQSRRKQQRQSPPQETTRQPSGLSKMMEGTDQDDMNGANASMAERSAQGQSVIQPVSQSVGERRGEKQDTHTHRERKREKDGESSHRLTDTVCWCLGGSHAPATASAMFPTMMKKSGCIDTRLSTQ